MQNKRVLLALSGGVDSSAAAVLLQKQGYELVACTMRLQPKGSASACHNEEDIEIAAQVAKTLGIPHHVADLSHDFDEMVVRPFVEAYSSALTPNPCVECNRKMKFGKLYTLAKELDCEYIATGHYARVTYDPERHRYLLLKAKALGKDQSYVLYTLSQEQLAHTLFPLGELNKKEARKLVAEAGLPNYSKAESMDICFIPDGDYVSFLENYRGQTFTPGSFVDLQGNILGQHRGLAAYTVGQRKGLGIAYSEPLYVLKLLPETNEILLVTKKDLYYSGLRADQVNIIACEQLEDGKVYQVRCRYHQAEIPARIWQKGINELELEFVYTEENRKQIAAPGQSLVIYDGDLVVGGGRIIEGLRQIN
ncbi:MAG: tRNA 2-thiouridine(34) synthase MnmA [Eubacteriales bacterium]|nr:tRNA 2-thiouridine(34) synthase MnmA [Eubacteriales bacterium]